MLIFVSETWVVTPGMGRVLGGLQDQVARQLMGQLLQCNSGCKWEYTSSAMARGEAGFLTIE